MDVIISKKQKDKLQGLLSKTIKTEGLEFVTRLVGGYKKLFEIFDIKTPMDFLHLYDDLEMFKSEYDSDHTLFRYVPKHNIMILTNETTPRYIPKHNIRRYVYIIWEGLWGVLWDYFKLSDEEIKELTLKWVNEVYNFEGVRGTMSLRNEEYIESL